MSALDLLSKFKTEASSLADIPATTKPEVTGSVTQVPTQNTNPLLAKFASAGITPVQNAIAATKEEGSAALPSSKALPTSNSFAKLAAATNTVTAQDKAQQQLAIKSAQEDIPEAIFTLNNEVHEIRDFDADNFSQILSTTYLALVNDQPDLANLLEKINTNLRQYEELSYLLTEDQLGLYIDGLMKLKAVNIKTTKPKKSAAQTQLTIDKEGGLDL